MKKTNRLFKLTLVAMLIVATVAVCAVVSSAAAKFTDVNGDEWYAEAVLKANELGIMNGTSESTFAPLKNLSRAEYVAILFRLSGGEENMEFT
ncbi:MAG: S-layer homology domain-containing protein, partial [Clostridia bacterium]|nr:S-layer homology domain-containing protein [Clostridia bacterium]